MLGHLGLTSDLLYRLGWGVCGSEVNEDYTYQHECYASREGLCEFFGGRGCRIYVVKSALAMLKVPDTPHTSG